MADDRDLKRLINLCRVDLTGASDAGIRQQVFEVVFEFLEDSSWWQEAIPFNTQVGVKDYPVVPASGGQIVRLVGVIDANILPQPAQMPVIGTVSLRDPPNTVFALTAAVTKNIAVPPDGQELVLPSDLLPLFSTYIADGICGRMMAQPNKSYANRQTSEYRTKRFRVGLNKARVMAIRRNTYGLNTWSYPQSFRTRGQRGGVSVGNSTEF